MNAFANPTRPMHIFILHLRRLWRLHFSRSWVLADDLLDLGLVCLTVLLEEIVCVGLSWGLWVWVVEEILDTEENLFYGDRGLPAFFFVEDRETNGTGGVDVGVK